MFIYAGQRDRGAIPAKMLHGRTPQLLAQHTSPLWLIQQFGHPPSEPVTGSSWLPAPNGIHFHPPTSLWVHTGERTMTGPLDHLVHHDLDDTRELLEAAKQLSDADYRRKLRPRQQVVWFEGNYEDYEKDYKRRMGTAADQPHRIKYKPLRKAG